MQSSKSVSIIKNLAIGFPLLILSSIYLHFFSLLSYASLTPENIRSLYPKSLPLSAWGNINLFLLAFVSPFILIITIILLFTQNSRKSSGIFIAGWLLLILLYLIDPMGIFSWLLD